jgi:hypothetical protein
MNDGDKEWLQEAGFNPTPAGIIGNYIYDANFNRTELLCRCLECGELKARNRWVLRDCPSCGSPKSRFVPVDED